MRDPLNADIKIDLNRLRRLAKDVIITPVSKLPEALLKEIYPEGKIPQGYFALERKRVRALPKIVNKDVVDVLQAFGRRGASYNDILEYFTKSRNLNRDELDPKLRKLVRSLIHNSFLVDVGDEQISSAESVEPSFKEGEEWLGYVIRENIHCLVDSEIYKIENRSTGEFRALKIAQNKFPNKEMKERITRRLNHEFEVMGYVNHPNVVKLWEQGIYEGRIYGILDWVDGPPVISYAHEMDFKATDRKLMKLAIQCAEALKAVHVAGYLHGDVHADNFLIRNGNVCLIDFGLTRPIEIKEEENYEEGGVILYMPPEYVRHVLEGRKGLWGSVAGEIYSLGVILFYLFTKRMPYTWNFRRNEYMKSILNEKPKGFEECERTPWPELEAVLHKALEKEKGKRFSSMAEFLEALRAIPLPPKADFSPFKDSGLDS